MSPLPLPPFQVVDQHFGIRLRAGDLRKKLEDRAVQFRNVEKRLLMRFKVCVGGGGEGGQFRNVGKRLLMRFKVGRGGQSPNRSGCSARVR